MSASRCGAPRQAAGRRRREIVAASHAWTDSDKQGDNARAEAALAERELHSAMVVVTGRTPHVRFHTYFRFAGKTTLDDVEAANEALKALLDSDAVQNADRVMRLAGTVNYPSRAKLERGYMPEMVELLLKPDAPAYRVEHLAALANGTAVEAASGAAGGTTSGAPSGSARKRAGEGPAKPGRTDAEIIALLEKSRIKGEWHVSMRSAVATMIGRGWDDSAIRMACRPYCRDGFGDTDLNHFIDRARDKWNKPEVLVEPGANSENDLARLNKMHAVLPIGGKTRVVTFGELEEFPGRETIVMTQTIDDFKALQNKYRHTYRDEKGELKSIPMGTYWIGNPKRRQYDGGMAFMPQHDGDVGNKLNLWRGFGVKAAKPPARPAPRLREVSRLHARHHLQRQQGALRISDASARPPSSRSGSAAKWRSACRPKRKAAARASMRGRWGGCSATTPCRSAIPKHIIGKFNPHLETLLRLTADEALFVGDHEHRNALFGLITEPTLTIEPKGCGVYTADNYLNCRSSATPSTSFRSATRRGGSSSRPCRLRASRTRHISPGYRKNSTTAATRRCSITCCTRSISPASMFARCRRRKGCGSSGTKACRRWMRGGASCWKAARCGDPIRRSRTGRSATATRA